MSSSMFHSGDLQSGISLAIKEQKLVACFIRADDDPTSTEWESEWLTELEEVVTEKAVLLRLDYGGKEAGFLGAFCKVEKAPTLVVIHNGRVLEQLKGGVERDEFVERLLKALGLGGDDAEEEAKPEVKLGDDTATGDVASAVSAIASSILPQSTQQQPPASSSAQTPSPLFPDRAARMEADKQQRDAAEKAAKQARQDARQKEAEDAYAHHRGDKGKGRATDDDDTGKRKARDSYLNQQKQRNDEAKRERARILAQIEADKANRKARSELARQASQGAEGQSEPLPQSRLAGSRRSAGAGGTCALQIRLFDGSSIRSRFPISSTLGKDVREWIREQAPMGSGGADIPYTFRQILAPKPSRSIEIGEEGESLQDLELVPNATLVLVPVAGSVNAYAEGAGGWMGMLMSSAYSSLPNVGSYLPSFSRLYTGGMGDEQEGSNTQGAAMAGADSLGNAGGGEIGKAPARTRTLFDQRAEAERKDKKMEFYNGNSSAFEGRKDGKEEEGKED